jgi:uncharacterized membrane protein YqhA
MRLEYSPYKIFLTKFRNTNYKQKTTSVVHQNTNQLKVTLTIHAQIVVTDT